MATAKRHEVVQICCELFGTCPKVSRCAHHAPMGEKAWEAANAISDARDKIDGTPEKEDQGIRVVGEANFVPSTSDAIAFHRTPQAVLHIIYLTDKTGVSKGGFYPNTSRAN